MGSNSKSSFGNRHSAFALRRAFTLFEFLIALAIIGLILASVIPYIMNQRELSKRIQCAKNLATIRGAMSWYARDFGSYPRVKYDDKSPNMWTAFTGATDRNPFAPDSAVQPNDVTASLWLLVRAGYITDSSVFLCPSAGGQRVQSSGPLKEMSNFPSGKNLGYSMFSPFSSAPGFYWADTLKPECALLADKSPGVSGGRDDVTRPSSDAAPEAFIVANSNNHGKAGQNVLYSDTSVEFVNSPYAGVGIERDKEGKWIVGKPGDNIYTALRKGPVPEGEKPPADGNGFYGKNVAPAWLYDSYLVPSDDD